MELLAVGPVLFVLEPPDLLGKIFEFGVVDSVSTGGDTPNRDQLSCSDKASTVTVLNAAVSRWMGTRYIDTYGNGAFDFSPGIMVCST